MSSLPDTSHLKRDTGSHTGIIKTFNNNTGSGGGYGFIAWSGEADMFVHISQVVGATEGKRATLFPGDQVSFEVRNRKQDGRPCAVNVRVQVRAAQAIPQHTRD